MIGHVEAAEDGRLCSHARKRGACFGRRGEAEKPWPMHPKSDCWPKLPGQVNSFCSAQLPPHCYVKAS